MATGFLRPTQRVVDCQALYHNVAEEIKLLPQGTELFAVVKANGYGHGAVKVAEIAKKAGATGFCVSILDEALELREAGFTEPILVLGVVEPCYLTVAVEHNIAVTAASLSWLQYASQLLQEDRIGQLTIHLKIDTGMGRLGLRTAEEISEVVRFLSDHSEFELEGVFTHFAKADSKDTDYFEKQNNRFAQALALLPNDIRYVHTANSATALWHEQNNCNLIRFGAAMYGLNPSGRELVAPFDLKQAMTLETEVVHIKQLPANESISYGATYTTTQEEWIATLPIGYADGLTRDFQGFTVLVGDKLVPIVGRVCMDQCMVRLNEPVPLGEKVIIFGNQDDQANDFQVGAEYAGTINYEIPCMLSERVPLVYVNEQLTAEE